MAGVGAMMPLCGMGDDRPQLRAHPFRLIQSKFIRNTVSSMEGTVFHGCRNVLAALSHPAHPFEGACA